MGTCLAPLAADARRDERANRAAAGAAVSTRASQHLDQQPR